MLFFTTLRYILKARLLKKRIRRGAKILEVGVGGGNVPARYLTGQKLYGIDLDDENIRACKKRLPGAKIKKCDAEHLLFDDNFFDHVICSETLYYMKHPEKFIREALRVLKPGGGLILLFHNQKYYRLWYGLNPFKSRFSDRPENIPHEQSFYGDDVEDMLKAAGFRVKERGSYSLIGVFMVAIK